MNLYYSKYEIHVQAQCVAIHSYTFVSLQEFRTYLNFCAIGLINAQLLDQSLALSRRLQVYIPS